MLIYSSKTLKTTMLTCAVVILVTLGADALFYPVQNTDVAAERESINSVQYNVDLYPQTEARATIVDKSHGIMNLSCTMNESDDHSGVWYRYLNSLYCALSTYNALVDRKMLNVADIRKWGDRKYERIDPKKWANNEGQGIFINESNLEMFLKKTKEDNIAEQNKIKDMKITESQFKELNHVFDLTIKDKLDISCVEPYMFIRGNNVILSHVSLSFKAGIVDETCMNLLDTDRLKYMNIFALNTVFMDDDISDIQKKFNLISVIAPRWEIIGERKIDLNGKDAESQGTTDGSANQPSAPAKNGKPGNPGESGRNFFGIGRDFIDGKKLSISANGGDGSPGENGKNGEDGRDGTSPTIPTYRVQCKRDLCDKGNRINSFECEKISEGCTPILGCTYRIRGYGGIPAGDGGNGGDGGKGGSPGGIVIFELEGPSGIKQSKNPGSSGSNGKGGVGGKGGKIEKVIEVKCSNGGYGGQTKWEEVKPENYSLSPSGKDGTDGKSMPAPNVTHIPNLYKAKMINQYKIFLRANIYDPFRNYFLVNFLNRLENNTDVKGVYDILGFIDELKNLEEQFHNLHRYVNFLPFYKSLLDRITDYAYNVNNRDDKKVLAYIYTATLARTHNLEDGLESNLISDITTYLELVKDDIEQLKEWQNGKVKEDITNEYKQKYKAEIDKKIKDANDIISREIIPEIHNIETDIDNQIKNLTNEVIKLQNETIVNYEKLKLRQEELQNELVLQGLFGSLKVFGTILGFMGPVGAAAGSVIDIGSGLAETVLLSSSDSAVENLEQSVADLDSLKEIINEFSDQKANELRKKLETVSEEIEQHEDLLGEMSVHVKSINTRLTTTEQNKITIKEVEGLEMELNATLQKQKNDLMAAQKGGDDKKTNDAVAVIDHLQNALQLTSVTLDTISKYKESQGKLTEIENAIQKNAETFNKLKKYEAEIYNTLVPMLENMEKDLDNIINRIKNESKVVLDVTRWKVKSTLKDMMLHLQRITKGFKVQDSLVRCIEKLQEAMNTLINVQDYIQDYQRDQTLANFIAGVSSVSINDFDISYNLMSNSDLRDALRDLEIIIRTSVVMQRHKVAIDAFKQFVFPFAHMYFKGTLLPSHLELDNENNTKLDDVIFKAINHIDHIKSKLAEHNASVNKYDQCSGVLKFINNVKSTKPFFVWQNETYGNEISRLLSGEEVIVSADMMHSPFIEMYDAIKFDYIEFGFYSKNKTIQSEINKILKGFKVTCTHLGNSYYRYRNDTYLITTADLTISYSFEKFDGEPILRNRIYIKMKHGDFLLSPFATWKIKLDRLNMTKKLSFKDLEKYKHKVDLMLEGEGHYVIRGAKNCLDLEVNKYYEPISEHDTENSTANHFMSSYTYDVVSRSRREIISENVIVSQEQEKTKNNFASSENGNRKADSGSWLSWFTFPKF